MSRRREEDRERITALASILLASRVAEMKEKPSPKALAVMAKESVHEAAQIIVSVDEQLCG